MEFNLSRGTGGEGSMLIGTYFFALPLLSFHSQQTEYKNYEVVLWSSEIETITYSQVVLWSSEIWTGLNIKIMNWTR
jgi:hypothetical protein